MFYEALKDLTEKGRRKWAPNFHVDGSMEGLVLGGLAGGICLAFASPSTMQFPFVLFND